MSDAHRRDAENESEDPKPNVGTDPEEEPEGGTKKHGVSLDKEKVREHEREREEQEHHESREEASERVKNA